ncbi:hypothetical protein VTG60DRAFT_3070 [Thermothelomyces hinnuleus]
MPDASIERAPPTCILGYSGPGCRHLFHPTGPGGSPSANPKQAGALNPPAAAPRTLSKLQPTRRAALDALEGASIAPTASVGWRSHVVGLGTYFCRHRGINHWFTAGHPPNHLGPWTITSIERAPVPPVTLLPSIGSNLLAYSATLPKFSPWKPSITAIDSLPMVLFLNDVAQQPRGFCLRGLVREGLWLSNRSILLHPSFVLR